MLKELIIRSTEEFITYKLEEIRLSERRFYQTSKSPMTIKIFKKLKTKYIMLYFIKPEQK